MLVELQDAVDPATGERYTVKRYESEKVDASEGGWRHFRVLLKPISPDFEPIELTTDDEGSIRVVAELMEVLG